MLQLLIVNMIVLPVMIAFFNGITYVQYTSTSVYWRTVH